LAEFFFDNCSFQESSHTEEIDPLESISLWIPEAMLLNYAQRGTCPFCETRFVSLTWFDDGGAQIYDELTTQSSVCNRCGFWTHSSLSEARATVSSRVFTSRIKTFDISELTAPCEGILAWLRKHPEDMYRVHPLALEGVVRDALQERLDCELSLTQTTRDGGVDLYGFDSKTGKFIVQVKRYARHRKAGVGIVREVTGTLVRENLSRGLIVSTSPFTSDAQQEAERLRSPEQIYPVDIDLIMLAELLEWLEIRDSRGAYPSSRAYWEAHLRQVLGSNFFGWVDFEQWQNR
jgi:hypothetical protein